jgi:hypothetical protein
MSWVESQGHRWPSGASSFYDRQKQQLVISGDQPTGHEPCEYCGMPYVEFSFALQQGTTIACSRKLFDSDRRILDGIIIVGPET